MSEKIQKVLANAGLGSRRQIETWITEGRVIVNRQVAKLGDRITTDATVTVDGRDIQLSKSANSKTRVLIYHKPEGEICSRSDPEKRPTVFEHLPLLRNGRWISIGRLDFNTSGVLLLTNDGELANQLMHPSAEIEREYAVRVHGEVTPAMLTKLRRGIKLEDGMAHFDKVTDAGGEGTNHWYHVIVKEGRNRLVRRLWESLDVKVSRLIRIRFGIITLPRLLARGRWEELEKQDITKLASITPPEATTEETDNPRNQETMRPNKPNRTNGRTMRNRKPARASETADRGERPTRSSDRYARDERPARKSDDRKPARFGDKSERGARSPRDSERYEGKPARSGGRAERGGERFSRDDRPARSNDRYSRDDRPARSGERSSRDDRPARSNDRYARDGKPARSSEGYSRDGKPARSNERTWRNDRPGRSSETSTRGDKPARSNERFSRDDRPARSNDRYSRDSKPVRSSEGYSRDGKPARSNERFSRDDRPARSNDRFSRDSKPARSSEGYSRDGKPARSNDRFSRDDKPARSNERFSRDDKPARERFSRDERPARSNERFSRDDRPARSSERPAREDRPRSGSLSPRGSKPAGSNRTATSSVKDKGYSARPQSDYVTPRDKDEKKGFSGNPKRPSRTSKSSKNPNPRQRQASRGKK